MGSWLFERTPGMSHTDAGVNKVQAHTPGRGRRRSCASALLALAAAGSLTVLVLPRAASAASCPNEGLRTGRSASLPDCRAYELVTPEEVASAGGELEFEGNALAAVSGDGEHVALHAPTVFFEPASVPFGTEGMFSRTAAGWALHAIAAGAEGEKLSMAWLSPDFSLAAIVSGPDRPNAPASVQVGPVGGPYATVTSGSATEFNLGANDGVAGGPAPASVIVLQSADHGLLPPGPERVMAEETQERASDLYESSGGRMRLANVDNEGRILNVCGAMLGAGAGTAGNAVNAVSADGSRVFFVSPDGHGSPCGEPALYMRVGGRETVDVSEPEEGAVAGGLVEFDGASPDGSRVFFTSESALTPEAGVGPFLYEYRPEAPAGHRLVLIARRVNRAEEQRTNPAVVVSGDGTVVYFHGTEPLEVGGQRTAVAGVWRYDAVSGETRFVAIAGNFGIPSAWYTTRDGRFLTFFAGEPPNEGVQILEPGGLEREPRGWGTNQMYRYDAEDGSVMCVSCGVGVAPSNGHVEAPEAGVAGVSALLPLAGRNPTPVDISEDGRRVFFQTSARLVAQDTNEETELEMFKGTLLSVAADVYEWEAPGTEDPPGVVCHGVNGCTFLISAGEGVDPEVLLGASEDGRDVFFSSAAALTAGAPPGFTSIYDARVGGGFPVKAGSVECSACQGVGSPPPQFGVGPSLGFVGTGNPPVPPAAGPAGKSKPKPKPRCKRGFRRNRHGRCVRMARRAGRRG